MTLESILADVKAGGLPAVVSTKLTPETVVEIKSLLDFSQQHKVDYFNCCILTKLTPDEIRAHGITQATYTA